MTHGRQKPHTCTGEQSSPGRLQLQNSTFSIRSSDQYHIRIQRLRSLSRSVLRLARVLFVCRLILIERLNGELERLGEREEVLTHLLELLEAARGERARFVDAVYLLYGRRRSVYSVLTIGDGGRTLIL